MCHHFDGENVGAGYYKFAILYFRNSRYGKEFMGIKNKNLTCRINSTKQSAISGAGKSILSLTTRNQVGPNSRTNGFDCSKYGSVENIKKALKKAIGTEQFYRIMSEVTPGDKQSGYHWNYGLKYFRRFHDSPLAKDDPTAARWIDCVGVRLQKHYLEDCFKYGANIEKCKKCAYKTHAKSYTQCGICTYSFSLISMVKVLFTPDRKDLWNAMGVSQMWDTGLHCSGRAAYSSRIIDYHSPFWIFDEKDFAKDLVRLAKKDPDGSYAHILALMDGLAVSDDDDDVAYYFMKFLSEADIDKLSKSGDGRRILFRMKKALSSGVVFDSERKQISRIGDKDHR